MGCPAPDAEVCCTATSTATTLYLCCYRIPGLAGQSASRHAPMRVDDARRLITGHMPPLALLYPQSRATLAYVVLVTVGIRVIPCACAVPVPGSRIVGVTASRSQRCGVEGIQCPPTLPLPSEKEADPMRHPRHHHQTSRQALAFVSPLLLLCPRHTSLSRAAACFPSASAYRLLAFSTSSPFL